MGQAVRRSSTSADAYREIEARGLLSRARFLAYRAFYENGPMTANEMGQHLARTGVRIACPWARCTEMCDLGVLVEVAVRGCKVTGFSASVWDVSGRLPSGKVESGTSARARFTALAVKFVDDTATRASQGKGVSRLRFAELEEALRSWRAEKDVS